MNTQSKTSIIESRELLLSDVFRLLNGEILAIRILDFASIELCEYWGKRMAQSNFQRYSNAQEIMVSKIGMTYFETENKPHLLSHYFEVADNMSVHLGELFNPKPEPLGLIHDAFKRVWPHSMQIRQLEGRNMCPGILRRIEGKNMMGLPPHQDMIIKELDNAHQDQLIKCQLATNLYIKVPDEGGELELWDYSPSLAEVAELYTGVYDFIDRSKLPAAITIKPQQGEFIIFRSNSIHAVAGCENADRTAASCFIGYYGDNHPLYYWS